MGLTCELGQVSHFYTYKPNTKTASIGGTIRNSAGTLLLAYSGRIAAENSLEAELKALFKGTDLRKDMNITHLQIEGDCLILVNSLQNSDSLSWSFMETWGSLIPNQLISQSFNGEKLLSVAGTLTKSLTVWPS